MFRGLKEPALQNTTNLTTIVPTSYSQALHKISQGSYKQTSRISKYLKYGYQLLLGYMFLLSDLHYLLIGENMFQLLSSHRPSYWVSEISLPIIK